MAGNKLARIHVDRGDRYAGKPLYEAIVDCCRQLGIAGATVLSGVEGYGETGHLHKAHLKNSDEPMVILIVDSAENVERLVAEAGAMIPTGMIAISTVDVVRVERQPL